MIKAFTHKGLKRFFNTGKPSGLPVKNVRKVARMLSALDNAETPEDLNIPGWRFHELTGDRVGTYSLSVNGNWRLTFEWRDGPINVNMEDYH